MTNLPEPTRLCIRLPCEFPAEISFSGGGTDIIKKATVSNISTTGIQILSPSFIATGQRVQASFKIPGQAAKTILSAEVIRIESLQGRMIGHYPYALGAKFVPSKKNDTKKIAHFISKKMTCASQRTLAGLLLLILGVIQIGQTLLCTVFVSSDLSALGLQDFSHFLTENWILHPVLSGALGLGFLSSAILCALNTKNFIGWIFFWAALQTLLSAVSFFVKNSLFSGDFIEIPFLGGELLIFGLGIGLIVVTLNLRAQFKKIERFLSADRSSSAPNRPTFTIL